ncbi:MAG: PQQ-binding-like beta-propeller repeat protein [Candidatus Sumerlaeaceae bacterium]|nr:PQQ-binding-like beta-propeller repeat protein [Candidatus Sumerlaeaceae bacterium]
MSVTRNETRSSSTGSTSFFRLARTGVSAPLWGVAFFLLFAAGARAEVKPFTFVQISDTHIGAPETEANLTSAILDIQKTFPEAEFIVNTGDVTDMGYNEEFTSYSAVVKAWKKPIYQAIGNHDVRWSESGKENYRNHLGETYINFEHNGVRFILLDVAMLIEHYAHFDGLQMEQLKKDLQALSPGEPAFIAMHHPPLLGRRFEDNEMEFADIIRQFNVPLVMVGHIHSLQRYAVNNTTFAAGGSTYDKKAYRVFKVGPEQIEVLTRNFDKQKTHKEAAIPTQRAASEIGALTVLESSDSGKLRFRLDNGDSAAFREASLEVDDFLTATATRQADGSFTAALGGLNSGRHEVLAQFVDDRGTTQMRVELFTTPKPRAKATGGAEDSAAATTVSIGRVFPLKSGSQCHPTLDGDVLYVGANDHFLRAIDLKNGKVLWERDLHREILSTPAIDGDNVITASLDKYVYCLNKKTGDIVWKRETGQAILASPLVADGVVYIGSGDCHMYALDAKTGAVKWKFPTAKLIKATPALANGKLFFGAWDNTFYCVDAANGQLVWKVPVSTRNLYSAATCNPATTGTKVIVVSHDYSVRCFDQATGSQLWIYKPKKDELGPSYSSPTIVGDVAYMGSIAGRIVGHNVETGEKVLDVELRPGKTDEVFDSVPLVVGEKLYAGTIGGNVYCVDLAKGKVDWSVALQPGFVLTRPVLWGNRLLVASMANAVFEIVGVE